MHIFNNDLSISGKSVDKKFSWTSGLLKKSEKEPTTVLENLTQDLRTEKDSEDTNQKALEEVRSSDTVRELFEKQNEGNVVNKHHYGDKGTNETQLNNAEGQRNDEYYSSGLSLFTREVFPKMRERMKKNEEFYKMPENKERVGKGDVVSAGAKEVKVVKAQSEDLWFRRFDHLRELVDKAEHAWENDNDESAKRKFELIKMKVSTFIEDLTNSISDREYHESPGAQREMREQDQFSHPEKYEPKGDDFVGSSKSVKVVKAQAALAEPTMVPSEVLTDNYIQEEIQQRQPEIQQQPEIQNQQMRQENTPQHKEQTHKEDAKKKSEDTGPKKHSLKYWNYITKEWKTIAENDDAKELESMKEEAIKKYYEGSPFSGQNAPFEIFVNEHMKKR